MASKPSSWATGRRRPIVPPTASLGLIAILLIQSCCHILSFIPPSPRLPIVIGTTTSTPTSRRVPKIEMIGSIFPTPVVPRSIKEGVTAMQKALQAGLKDRLSRMEIVFPRGVSLGVEAPSLDKYGDPVDKADRELARLLVECFRPLEESTVVIFREDRQVQKAQSVWGDELKIMFRSFESVKKKGGGKKKKKSSGFGDQGGVSLVPEGAEVVIVVAPGPVELARIRRTAEELGPGVLVVLVNSRLDFTIYNSPDDKEELMKAFTTIFSLSPVSSQTVQTKDNMLLYRAYPSKYVFAQKPPVGAPRVIEEKDDRFNQDELMELVKKGAEFNELGMLDQLKNSIFGS